MLRRRPALRLLLAACIAATTWAVARSTVIVIPIHPEDGNLVSNPHFDTYAGALSGWTESPTDPPDSAELCTSCDFEEQVGSNGVLLVIEEPGVGELETCVPIVGGAEYDIGVWVKLPVTTPAGFAGIHIVYMADAACTTVLQDQTSTGVTPDFPLYFEWKQVINPFVAPAAARAVRLALKVQKTDGVETGSFKAALDEPFIIPEPSATALPALAMLAWLRRRRIR
jgi:hypothetical protein